MLPSSIASQTTGTSSITDKKYARFNTDQDKILQHYFTAYQLHEENVKLKKHQLDELVKELNCVIESASSGPLKKATRENVTQKIKNMRVAAKKERSDTASDLSAAAAGASGEGYGTWGSGDISALRPFSGSVSDTHQPPTILRKYSIGGQTYIPEGGVLGRGAFGTVLKVTGQDGQQYALKKVQFNTSTEEKRNEVMREAQILSALRHKNVLSCHDFAFLPEGFVMVMPLCFENLRQRCVVRLMYLITILISACWSWYHDSIVFHRLNSATAVLDVNGKLTMRT